MAAQARSICVDKRSCILLRLIQRRRRFAAGLLPRLFGNNVPGRTTRAPPVGFELATTGIQFRKYAKFATLSESPASPGLREFAAALITTTVWEQHPRSRHKGATSIQTLGTGPGDRRHFYVDSMPISPDIVLCIDRVV